MTGLNFYFETPASDVTTTRKCRVDKDRGSCVFPSLSAGMAVVLRALRTPLTRSLAPACSRCSAPLELVLPPAPRALPPPWMSSCVRTLQLSSALCAGHNKWSKVKHIKGPKDLARAKVMTKMAWLIRIAVKEGGSNPDHNQNLAQLVEICKSKSIPKASIDSAIKGAEKAKPLLQYMVEARGPGGCLLLIDVLTDDKCRCQQDIKRLLARNGGVVSDGVRHAYTRRGMVEVAGGDSVTMERALELAIESGAADVQETEDEEEQPLLKFICDTTDIQKVRTSLEKLGTRVVSSGVEFVPKTLVSLDEAQLQAASTLVEALTDCPDVVQVWENVQADS